MPCQTLNPKPWTACFTGDALLIRGCGRTDFQVCCVCWRMLTYADPRVRAYRLSGILTDHDVSGRMPTYADPRVRAYRTLYVSSYYYICPHTTWDIYCPHTTIYVSSGYICPHTTTCLVPSYYYISVLILDALQVGDPAKQYENVCGRMLTYADVCWCDAPQAGDPAHLYENVHQQIFSLPDSCVVYPGDTPYADVCWRMSFVARLLCCLPW